MSRFFFSITISLLFFANCFAQFSLEDLNIVFKHNFENNTIGNYSSNEWYNDWFKPGWNNRQSETDIVKDNTDTANASKVIQLNFPKNSLGASEGGTQWWTMLSNQEELYISYDLMFMPGFKFQLGGKLPSVQGGVIDVGAKPIGNDGFTGGLMFHVDGEIAFYSYFPDQTTDYGQTILWGGKYSKYSFSPSKMIVEYTSGSIVKCVPGIWNNLTYRMVLNTISTTGRANYDGILEAYFNGKMVLQLSHMLFRKVKELGIDRFRFYSFFGGGTDEYRNPISEWLRIDNVILYTFNNSCEVPRGNILSPVDRTINYWRMFSYFSENPPASPSSLLATDITKSSVILKWTDNANNELGYTIEHSLSATEGFVEIGKVTANVTAFTCKNLSANTNHYFRIRAFNNADASSYTAVLPVKTLALQPPAAPTGFVSTAQTKYSITLAWTDNAQNEQGFSILRAASADGEYKEITKQAANVTTYTNSNLNPATTYYYKIRAFNDDGGSAFTTAIAATTKPLELPAAPSGLIASQIAYESATLVWKDNATNETGFELTRNLTGENTPVQVNLPAGTTSYSDATLDMNTSYQYRIRAINGDGTSAWSNTITVVTPRLLPPATPTKLKSTKYTDKSISVSWKDNSANEDAFVITRSLADDLASAVNISISANDTAFTDSSLVSSTTYQYTIKAVNKGGSSSSSNKNVATTLSHAELKRVKEGLVAYYNFGYNPDYIVYDQSGYGDPLNLNILSRSAVNWNKDNTLDILSNTAIVSLTPATKIIRAIKETGEITFECWLKPKEPVFTMPARIASISASDSELGFALDQQLVETIDNKELSYHVRMQTASTVNSGYPEYTPDVVQPYINLQHLVYTRNAQGMENVYLNGVKSSEGFRPSELDTWKDSYYLRLSNESDMNHSWTGSYYSVALFNKALSADEVMVNYSTGPCDSVEMENVDYTINVYPNPAVDQVYLQITPVKITDNVPHTTICIWDAFGKLRYKQNLFNPNESLIRELPLGNLPAGIYLVQVISGSKQQSAKVILQK